MSVSKTPVNKHDIVSNIPLSVEVYQVSLASVNSWNVSDPWNNPSHHKAKNIDPTQPVGQPNPWVDPTHG